MDDQTEIKEEIPKPKKLKQDEVDIVFFDCPDMYEDADWEVE